MMLRIEFTNTDHENRFESSKRCEIYFTDIYSAFTIWHLLHRELNKKHVYIFDQTGQEIDFTQGISAAIEQIHQDWCE